MQGGEAARQRILTCLDLPTLERWFDWGPQATRLGEMLDGLAR